MNSPDSPITSTIRLARYAIAGVILALGLILTLLPAGIPPRSDASLSGVGLPGSWYTYANGDAVQALAVSGTSLWAGTAGGGAVEWNTTAGTYTQYLHPQAGLACNDVRDIAVDGAGNVWFATCRGLSIRSPGGEWQTHTVASTGGALPSDNVTSISFDADGAWIGTGQAWNGAAFTGGGLARVDWGTAEWHSPLTPPTSPYVNDTAVTSDGKLWVGTLPYTTWVPPTQTQPGHWGRVGGGLAVWDGTRWQSYTSESDVADSVPVVAADADGNLWAGTEGNGAFAFTATGLVHFEASRAGLADGYINSIGFGPSGRVWFGTRKFNGSGTGISVLDPGADVRTTDDDTWQRFTVADGVAADLVAAIVGDGAQLWLGTTSPDGVGSGISRFQSGSFAPPLLTRPTNLAGNHVTTAAVAPDGRLWVGTAQSGVSVLSQDRRTWTTYTRQNTDPDGRAPWTGLRGNSISSIAVDSQGRLWIGTRRTSYNLDLRDFEDGGLSVFDPAANAWSSFTRFGTDDNGRAPWLGLRSDEVSAVAVDWVDHVWVGSGSLESFTGDGISELDPSGTPGEHGDDVWTHHDIFDGVPSNNITQIRMDRERQLVWVASAPFWRNGTSVGGGVGRYDGANWTAWDSDDLVAAEDEIRSLALGQGGTVWAGGWTYQGSFHWPSGIGIDAVVNMFDGSTWTARGIFEDDGYAAALAVTSDGAAWAGTSKDGHGAAPATGGVRRLLEGTWSQYTSDNSGLAGNEVQAITPGSEGDLWFGLRTRGLSLYSASVQSEPTPTPQPAATPSATPTRPTPPRIQHVYLSLMLRNHRGVQPPPTATPTVTLTPTPGATPTATRTLPPGVTPTATPTLPPGTTATATVTATPSPTPTRPLPTVTPTPTPKPIPGGVWAPVLNVPPVDLFDVAYVEVSNAPGSALVWAVGDQGVVLHSQDGGETWDFQNTPTDVVLSAVAFVDAREGWAAGAEGTILHTVDGGQTWQSQTSPVPDETIVGIAMTSAANGWAVTSAGSALRWNGAGWTRQAATNYKFTALALTSDDDGWATSAEADSLGRVVRLADGRWMSAATFQGLQAIDISDDGVGWAAGNRGTVVHQLDAVWEYVSRPPAGGLALYAVHSPARDSAWVMGEGGLVFYYDRDHWENKTDSRVTRRTLYAVEMTADGDEGWAVGEAAVDSGTILQFYPSP